MSPTITTPIRLACLLLCCAVPAAAAPGKDAAALLQAAEAHYDAVGREKALADFTRDARFVEGSLYVFCVDGQNRLSASGGFPRMVGVDIDRFEVGGRSGLASHMQQDSDSQGELAYDWLNPQSGAVEPKQVRYRRFGEDVCAVGEYTPSPSGPPRRR